MGAITILECDRKYSNKNDQRTLKSLAYAAFHNGDYRKSIDTYDELLKKHDADQNFRLYKACCFYALCQYKEAKQECALAENEDVDEALLNRLQLHLSHKMMEEENIMNNHSKLTLSVEDQLWINK